MDDATGKAFLSRLRDAAAASGLFDFLKTNWLCLDCELMPWSSKAQELIRQQYAPVGSAGIMTLTAEEASLRHACERLPELTALADRTSQRLSAMHNYVREYRQYSWPVNSLADLKLAPFHLLASEGAVHTDRPASVEPLQNEVALQQCKFLLVSAALVR